MQFCGTGQSQAVTGKERSCEASPHPNTHTHTPQSLQFLRVTTFPHPLTNFQMWASYTLHSSPGEEDDRCLPDLKSPHSRAQATMSNRGNTRGSSWLLREPKPPQRPSLKSTTGATRHTQLLHSTSGPRVRVKNKIHAKFQKIWKIRTKAIWSIFFYMTCGNAHIGAISG